jgi:hypothetical protein
MSEYRSASPARQPAWRMPLIIAVVAVLAIGAGVALALALGGRDGTASESPTATASPSPDPAETPAGSPEPTGTPEPTASPDGEVALFAPWQSVLVTVDGLAVRRGPGTDFDLVSSYRYDAGSDSEVLDEEGVRLDTGHYLWVEDGPLVIDGVPWYRVYDSLPQTEPRDGPARWDADGDEFRADAGWVAGGLGAQAYLVPEEAPEPDGPVVGEGPDPYAIIYGTGGHATEPFTPVAPVGIRWAAAAPDGGSCTITFRLEPAGVEMASVRVDRWAIGDAFWPEDGSLPDGDQRVEVETDCTWSLRVVPIIG